MKHNYLKLKNNMSFSILHIEDNEACQEAIRSVFRNGEDYAVDVSSSAAETRCKLMRNSYDLILADLLLPDSEGMETIRRICDFCGDTPIIVFSGTGASRDDATFTEYIRESKGRVVDTFVKGKDSPSILLKKVKTEAEIYRAKKTSQQSGNGNEGKKIRKLMAQAIARNMTEQELAYGAGA